MKNLDSNLCSLFKEARRSRALSQSVVAMEVGCKQSALSMFEQGDPTKLSSEVVEKLAKKFDIDLSAPVEVRPAATVFGVAHSGYCPNRSCPSHARYLVDGKELFRPNPVETDPVGGKFCAVCGEVLERNCPHCGAKIHPGAVCSVCGQPYVC